MVFPTVNVAIQAKLYAHCKHLLNKCEPITYLYFQFNTKLK